MYEVEIKVPADVDAVRRRLRASGGERVDARRQRDVYYDAPHREFAETDEALRLRNETALRSGLDSDVVGGSTTKLTYKGPLLDAASKTRSEHETMVDDRDAAEGILSGLGFDPAATVRKRREFWALDGYTVTLDVVDGVGEFVEIEREVAAEDAIDATREEAVTVLDRLGLDADAQVRTSYLGLLLAARETEGTEDGRDDLTGETDVDGDY
ncbi:class IV adenylate cyclase [Halorubrum sp. DTA98]|uniref:class IV adenylate cyclase n=1 Tax=Halorubrum sp. DTA98 TaxID=3402163 RepID=UPI003AAA5453